MCELDDEQVIRRLAENTLIIYIKATEENEKALIERAESDPKPLYYRESFLDEQLAEFLKLNNLEYAALINPDDFVRWVFPRLFYSRIPRYEAIANNYGYTVSTKEIESVRNEKDFIRVISRVLDSQA